MGQSDTVTASIGIRILVSELILQMNETNMELIKKILCDGCIEDENGIYNEKFKHIVGYEYEDNELPNEYLQCKEHLINEFKKNGSYDFSDGCLLDKQLLFPIKNILSTERWGYNRVGINSSSRPLDFNLSINTEEYKEIKNFNIVFIIKQCTG